jgi:uncharacterized protein involved in exopolysaccharide biosynthesis
MAITLTSSVTAALLMPRQYRASALVEAVWESEADAARLRMAGKVADRRLQVVKAQLLSRSTLEKAVRDASPYRQETGEEPPFTVQLERIRAAVRVDFRGPDAFLIQYVHDDPATAALVTNRLASLLVEKNETEREARAVANPAILEARLVDARKGLAARARLLKESRAARAPQHDRDRLAREYDEAYEAYLKLQNEWRAAETVASIGRSSAARFSVVSPASVPSRPDVPNPLLFALAGLTFGFALSLAAAIVAESRDRSIKGPEDLHAIVPQPLLAELPLIRVSRRGRRK